VEHVQQWKGMVMVVRDIEARMLSRGSLRWKAFVDGYIDMRYAGFDAVR